MSYNQEQFYRQQNLKAWRERPEDMMSDGAWLFSFIVALIIGIPVAIWFFTLPTDEDKILNKRAEYRQEYNLKSLEDQEEYVHPDDYYPSNY